MPRTALGHARLAPRVDLVRYRARSILNYHRVFWWDQSATKAGGRCRTANPSPQSHSACARRAGLAAWVGAASLGHNETSDGQSVWARRRRLGRAGACGKFFQDV